MRLFQWFRRSTEAVVESIPSQRRSAEAERLQQAMRERIAERAQERREFYKARRLARLETVRNMTPEQKRDLEERAYSLHLAMRAFGVRSHSKLTPTAHELIEMGKLVGITAAAVPSDFDVEEAKANAELGLFVLGPNGVPEADRGVSGSDYSGSSSSSRAGRYGANDTGFSLTTTYGAISSSGF